MFNKRKRAEKEREKIDYLLNKSFFFPSYVSGRTEKKKNLMPTTGIEPVTFALRERRSTTELNRHGDIEQKNGYRRFQSAPKFFLSFMSRALRHRAKEFFIVVKNSTMKKEKELPFL